MGQWNTAIMKTIPKERLLVYRVEEGWKPLANFLGLPEPEVPFPSVNDGATVTVIIVGGYYLLMLGLPLLLVSLLCWRWRRRLIKPQILQLICTQDSASRSIAGYD